MDVFSRMLVAVDGSTPSEVAVLLALAFAGPQSRIRLVTVVESDESVGRAALDAARTAARARGVEVETTRHFGHPVDEILDEADAWNSTCIVIGTRGRGGLAHALFGSCAQGVLRRCARPVLVARSTQSAACPIDRVLCAFDGSPAAQRAFAAAAAFAAERDAELHVVSVVQLDDLYATGYERDHFDPDGSIGTLYDEARRAIKAVAAQAIAPGARIAPHVVGGADVAAIITGCVVRYGCGLVMLGTHGRRGIGRAVLGSTAEGVIRDAAAPVLVFHERRPVRETSDKPTAIRRAR